MEKIDVTIGNRTIPLVIRKSVLAKRISLRMSAAKNSVVLTLPRRSSLATGIQFLNSKSAWVLANTEENSVITITDGTTLPILGKPYTIKRMDGRGISHLNPETSQLIVYCLPEFVSRRVKDFLKKLLCEECTKIGREFAHTLGKRITKVVTSKASSRWGTCNANGVLSFNWLLVFAPKAILEYVIAHETAHLKEMNHSPKFWMVVEKLYPDTTLARKWLKNNGHMLHKYE